MLYVGIDPGVNGAVAFVEGKNLRIAKTPTMIKKIGRKKKKQYDIAGMVKLLNISKPKMVVLESVHAMPGQGVSTMFAMGKGFGIWLGILEALNLPYTLVPAPTWHKSLPKLAKYKQNPKLASLDYAKKHFPNEKFLPTPRCSKADDNMTDATCLAIYATNNF